MGNRNPARFYWRGLCWEARVRSDTAYRIVARSADGTREFSFDDLRGTRPCDWRCFLNELIIARVTAGTVNNKPSFWPCDRVPWDINLLPSPHAYKSARDAWIAERLRAPTHKFRTDISRWETRF